MRCKNCGWPNKPNVDKCVKCGEPLVNDPVSQFNPTAPINDKGPEASNLKKTVIEPGGGGYVNNPISGTTPIGGDKAASTVPINGGESTCAKCGYPLRPGVSKCPNCNTPVSGTTPTMPINNEPVNPAPSPQPNHHPAPKRPTTINPYLMDMDPTPMCSLKPIKKVGERREPVVQEYDGKEIVLNRENTDPDNGSITSREQAQLTFKDGVWYIEDRSEQKTTFVRAIRPTELCDGDIVLLGNRMFEFHS